VDSTDSTSFCGMISIPLDEQAAVFGGSGGIGGGVDNV
jgi:hypothetical protein